MNSQPVAEQPKLHGHVQAPRSTTTDHARFQLLEGLRGWMAWWVVLGHYIAESGFKAIWLPSFARIAALPGFAVDVFVILSGFVITHLLSTKQTGYGDFIGRRFFRLYPLYFVCVVVGLATFNVVHTFYFEYAQLVGSTAQSAETWKGHAENLWTHVGISLTMFHGAVPQALLQNAQSAFVSPGWSISLEWQFYLVIPLVFWTAKRSLVSTCIAVLLFTAFRQHYHTGKWGSFLPDHAEYFALGILSYHAFQMLRAWQSRVGRTVPWTLLTAFLIAMLVTPVRDLFVRPYEIAVGEWLPLSIWIFAFAVLLETHGPRPGKIASWTASLFQNQYSQWLGTVSYSTYLMHYFVIYLVMGAILHLGFEADKYTSLLAMLLIGAPITLALSALCYRFIEQPGIALGRRVLCPPPLRNQ